MNDKEIAKLYHLSRSAISYTRNKGLEKRKRKIASTLTFLGGCFAATNI